MAEQPLILIVEDEPANLNVLDLLLRQMGYRTFCAHDGLEAKEFMEKELPDLVLTDVMMPRMDGYELCTWIKSNPITRLIPVVLLTGLNRLDDKIHGIETGADDFLTKPFEHVELRARITSLLKLKSFTDELENAEGVIFSLALAVEVKDHYTQGHCFRLSQHGMEVGRRLGLDDDMLQAIRRGGILHDIGKIGIPDRILLKPGPLTGSEREIMRAHPEKGEGICKPLHTLAPALPIIRNHHERVDGNGYPDGLKSDEIHIGAKIIAAVDLFDALVTDRPYREALPFREALRILQAARDDGHLDKDVTRVLVGFVSEIAERWVSDEFTHNIFKKVF